MSKSIIGIANNSLELENAVQDLQTSASVPVQDISVLVPDREGNPNLGTVKTTKVPEGTTAGVVTGGVLGGGLGLLAGIGALAIPGLGAFIAAGPLLAALSGAAAGATVGGVVGALVGLGIPEYEAKAYEKRLKEGGYLLAVHVSDSKRAKDVTEVLKRNGLTDISTVSED